jgi:glycosyltransferase involved in cell wall biosynthesis
MLTVEHRSELKRELGVDRSANLVVVLSSRQYVADYVETCVRTLQHRPACQVRVRLHPLDDPSPVLLRMRQLGLTESALVRDRVLDALVAADLVVSQWSTVIGEAVLAGAPIVLADLYGLGGADEYLNAGVCLAATTTAELASAIAKGLDDEDTRRTLADARHEFVRRFFNGLDGRAADRVAATVSQVVQRSRGVAPVDGTQRQTSR